MSQHFAHALLAAAERLDTLTSNEAKEYAKLLRTFAAICPTRRVVFDYFYYFMGAAAWCGDPDTGAVLLEIASKLHESLSAEPTDEDDIEHARRVE